MSVTISYELGAFLFSAFAGIICSIIFDFFRAIRHTFTQGILVIGISDITFWIICCIICFITIFNKSSGELRFYQFAAIIISSFLYFLTLSKVIKCIFVNFLKFIKFIFKILLTPLEFLYKILLSVFFTKPTKNDSCGGTDETHKTQNNYLCESEQKKD